MSDADRDSEGVYYMERADFEARELQEEAFGIEYFVCVRGCNPSDRKEENLFEGI